MARRNTKPTEERIRVRMYRVGFGDCFLVSLPLNGTYRHILVDCGVHAKGDIGTMPRIIKDIEKETDHRIAVVVASHRHQDHISGFAIGETSFGRCTVDEVWMPWTEDPADVRARTLRDKRIALVQSLRLHFAARGAAEGPYVAEVLENATGIGLDGASFAGGNEHAMSVLRSGFAGDPKVRYLKAGDLVERPADFAGLSVRVLGPPVDEAYLRQMDPPKPDRYLAGSAGGNAPGGMRGKRDRLEPFQASWKVSKSSIPKSSRLSKEDEVALQRQAASPLSGLAFALDQAINNTSLVLLISYRGKTLLFPGDAQYGNWRFWLEKPENAALLADVSFYKVSHHGSVNATPKRVVERLPKGKFAAMASTQSVPWGSIPRPPLMKALAAAASGIVQSDSVFVKGAPVGPELTRMPRGFSRGEFWVDYVL